nr:unnamed protein product [Callosobruchus analis]
MRIDVESNNLGLGEWTCVLVERTCFVSVGKLTEFLMAGGLDHLESQYLPPTGRVAGSSQYPGTASTQFAGQNAYPGSTATQHSQPEQPIAFGRSLSVYQHQQGQYSAEIQDVRYDGTRGQYTTQYSGAATVRAENQPNGGDGIYSYSFETSNGISAQESGTGSVGAQGGYSYTSPDGEVISVRKSIEINKAEAASGRYQDGQYEEEGYDGPSQQYGSAARGQFRQQYATPGQQHYSSNQQYGAQGVRDGFEFTGQKQYGVPSQQQQFRTPGQQYGAQGVRASFGFSGQQQYGIPSLQQQFRIAGQQYGTPAVGNQSGASFQQQYNTPTQEYGVSSQYNAPSLQYNALRQSLIGTGRQNSQQFEQQYRTTSSRDTFGERQDFGAPAPQYGTPTGPVRSENSNQGYWY